MQFLLQFMPLKVVFDRLCKRFDYRKDLSEFCERLTRLPMEAKDHKLMEAIDALRIARSRRGVCAASVRNALPRRIEVGIFGTRYCYFLKISAYLCSCDAWREGVALAERMEAHGSEQRVDVVRQDGSGFVNRGPTPITRTQLANAMLDESVCAPFGGDFSLRFEVTDALSKVELLRHLAVLEGKRDVLVVYR